VITIGLSILAYAIEIILWGDAPRSFEGLPGRVQILGVPVQAQYLLVFGVSLVAFIVMELLFSRTYIGKALTASASNPRAARLVGIDIKKMGLISFAIAGALGGLAGVLITPLRELSYNSDMLLVLSGFAAAVFGGLNSPIKTAIGGLVLGIVGMLVAGYWNGQFQTEVALIAMLLVMIVRSRRLTAEEAR
jgi:branched-chain amino acid transport system permease protein